MKKIVMLAMLLLAYISMSAQPPQGGRGGRPPGGEGGRPPMGNQMSGDNKPWVMKLPEISDLTLDQRTKLVDALSKEQADISKLTGERQALKIQIDNNPNLTPKEKDKIIKKVDKVNEKIRKAKVKYDKKYHSILSDEQYKQFEIGRKDIKFGNPPRSGGVGIPRGENSESRPDRDQMPPDMPDNMD